MDFFCGKCVFRGIAGNPETVRGNFPEGLVGSEGIQAFCPEDFPGGRVIERPPGFQDFQRQGNGIFQGRKNAPSMKQSPCSALFI